MECKNTKNIEFTFLYIIVFALYCLNSFIDRFSLFYFGSYAYIYKALIYLIWLFVAVFSYRKNISVYMNIFIYILFIYMFFDVKIGAIAFITYFLPAIATFFFFSNCIRSKTQINFIISGLGGGFILSVFYAIFNEIFGYADFEKEAFNLVGNLFESDGKIRIRSFFAGDQTLYIYGISIVILSYIFKNKYRYIFLISLVTLYFFYIPKNQLAFVAILIFILFLLKTKFNPMLFHIYFFVNICILYYFAKITYLSGVWSLYGSWLHYTPFGVPSVITRYEIWDNAISLFFNNPLGYGLGAASYVFGDTKVITPHSEYLKALIEFGVFGFCVFYAFLYHIIKMSWSLYIKMKDSTFLYFIAYIFAFVFISFFNDHIFGNAEKLFFWMISGLIYNFEYRQLNGKTSN